MVKAMNLIGLYVKNPAESAAFYKQLGFEKLNQTGALAEIKLGNMKLDLISVATAKKSGEKFEKEAAAEPKGAGLYLNIETDNIDEFYQSLISLGMRPSSEPHDWPWGHREFALRDPDGYKLVFYEKLQQTNKQS